MRSSVYLTECSICKEETFVEICKTCLKKLFERGEQGNDSKNKLLLCDNCKERVSNALCDDCENSVIYVNPDNQELYILVECAKCQEEVFLSICKKCNRKLHKEGDSHNREGNLDLLCELCKEIVYHILCDDCRQNIPSSIIFDIESRNHLKSDCAGDSTKLKLGLAGIKELNKNVYLFFEESNVNNLKQLLYNTEKIIGYNLVGHNGLDYMILKNYGFKIALLTHKTYDLMTVFIRNFGSFDYFGLDNIAEHTLGVRKKKSKKANYKLIQSGQLEKVKDNLKHELNIIEELFHRLENGYDIRFRTPSGLIDEHVVEDFRGYYPEYGEEVIDPYDFPLGGMRLQIKNRYDYTIQCKKCGITWRIRSLTYYGDTMTTKVYCFNCKEYLDDVRTSCFGEDIKIDEVNSDLKQ